MKQAKNVMGFDCEFLEPPPENLQTDCPVCLQIIREPHQVTCCGKKFCKACIERVQGSCPTCKAQEFRCFPDKGIKQSLYGLKVRCSHQKDGCEWTGVLRHLDEHTDLLHETIQSITTRIAKLESSHGRLKSSPVPDLKDRGGNKILSLGSVMSLSIQFHRSPYVLNFLLFVQL